VLDAALRDAEPVAPGGHVVEHRAVIGHERDDVEAVQVWFAGTDRPVPQCDVEAPLGVDQAAPRSTPSSTNSAHSLTSSSRRYQLTLRVRLVTGSWTWRSGRVR
jgi:hypothetical protein